MAVAGTVQSQGELIGDRIARFTHPTCTPSTLPPFPGYSQQPQRIGDLPASWPLRPRFQRFKGGSYIQIFNTGNAHYYATGEQAGPLLRNGTRKVLWNTDAYAYTDATKSLYQSHPFIMGLSKPCEAAPTSRTLRAPSCVPKAFGIIIETTHRCTTDLRPQANGIAVEVNGPMPAITIILRDTPQEVCQALAMLTGTMALPPRWALGYHQCRYTYEPEAQVREIAAGFRNRTIPCDCLWLDIDYMDGYRCFTFDPVKFPDPAGLVRDLHAQHFRVVSMIDPGIKVDESYSVYQSGRAGNHFIKDAAGNEYHGDVWPGTCAFPDFTNAACREWWSNLYAPLVDLGIDGFWNDMNEPAVFHVPSKTMPLDNQHDADEDLGGPAPHAKYHNIYGTQMARATLAGLTTLRLDTRPFLLTRSAFLGSQRYAATWTGDNQANEDHCRWSIPMALNLGLSGQPFAGPDIGGFDGDTDPDLFARWMGIGALLPFARGHKNKGTKMHEPWALGAECEKVCRLALERRYRLLPYLYTVFEESSRTGLPVVRPVFFHDADDLRLRTVDDAFLIGADVLVRTHDGSPMPGGHWQAFELTEAHASLPRLFLREGTALPIGPVMQHHAEKPLDPLTLLVNLDANGRAEGTLYEDDGETLAHTRGLFRRTMFTVAVGPDAKPVLNVTQEGPYEPVARTTNVLLLKESR